MSTQSLALLRKHQSEDLAKLAEEHFQHELNEDDRIALKAAAATVFRHALVGSIVGIGLGAFLAFRIRANRAKMYNAFRATERPTHVKFADGREEAIPDITPLLKPTTLGDVLTYTFFGAGGMFLGGETGLLTGTASAKRSITRDPETKARIEKAFGRFRVDVLRKEIEQLERQQTYPALLLG